MLKLKLILLYRDKWNLEAGKAYYYTRNVSSIVAFVIGNQCKQTGPSVFKIVGCHTDSPVLKLAPHNKVENKFGF
jgi:aspartyl aminopeptidase